MAFLQPTAQALPQWLAERVATYVRHPVSDIDTDINLAEYGLDSVFALTLTGDIEDHLGLTLEPTIIWDHPTIDALATALQVKLGQVKAAVPAQI